MFMYIKDVVFNSIWYSSSTEMKHVFREPRFMVQCLPLSFAETARREKRAATMPLQQVISNQE